jgi:tRNA G37 N-methylase Trm5
VEQWTCSLAPAFEALGWAEGKHWRGVVAHVEVVKSYAPRVAHLVADLYLAPPTPL